MTSPSSTLTLDLNAPTTPFPHYWERCVGSDHAAMGLREDWRQQLKQCHDELGFQYVRFHGLLDNDMSVYSKWDNKPPVYSFFNVDSIFDFLLRIGMKPFVELSFMPDDLASGSTTCFQYRGNTTPPKSYADWGALIHTLTAHLVARYGVDEVRTWFFEVWNEPNLAYFWRGTQEEYFTLYRHAAESIKSVDVKLRIGGPATAVNAWIPELKTFCQRSGTPLDFVSTHHYPTDAALDLDGSDMVAMMNKAGRGVLRRMTAKARQEAGDLLLYYTEWSNSPSTRDPWHDEPYAAAFAVKTIVDNLGLADIYSFWTFSDIFEEMPLPSAPFYGGFGLLTLHGVPKPTYRAFQLLHALGDERIPVEADLHATVEAAAVRKGDGVTILVYNHDVPLANIQDERVQIVLQGFKGEPKASVERIDADHANPKRCWQELGSPEYPHPKMIRELIAASELKQETLAGSRQGESIVFELTIPPHGIAAIHLR